LPGGGLRSILYMQVHGQARNRQDAAQAVLDALSLPLFAKPYLCAAVRPLPVFPGVCFERRLESGTTMEARVVWVEALEHVVRLFGQLSPAEGPINLQIRMDREGSSLRVALHYLRGQPIEPVEVKPVRIFRYLEQLTVPSEW
jgi:hypothetical protein